MGRALRSHGERGRRGGRRRWIAGVALVVAAAVAACRTDDAPIRIGVVVDGDGIVGARLALEDALASGGIAGRPLELVVVPPRMATVAEPSILAADSLADDPRVVAVVGHSNSAASLAASQVYNARGLVHIAPNTTAPLFGEAGPYSFRLVPDDHRQADFLVRQVRAASTARLALAFVNDDYGRALAAEVRTRLARAGIRPVYETPYLEGADSTQLAAAATAIADARPDMLLWLGRGRELALLLGTLRARLPDLPVYGSDGVDVSHTYAAPRRVEGVRFVRFVDAAANDARLRAFRARFRTRERRETTTDAVLAYDATQLVVAALRAGARDRDGVRADLESLGHDRPPFAGLSGPIAFDERGDVTRRHLLAEVRDGAVHAIPAR